MPQTVQQTLQDPKFYGLPAAEQQKVLATLDPNYARLPLTERNKVLEMGRQRFGSTSPAASSASNLGSSPAPDASEAAANPASFWDRLTEIQKPDPNHPWSYKEALKAVGNIGAGGLGLLLHPIDSIQAAIAPVVAAMPSYANGPFPMPNPNLIPTADAMRRGITDNPYGTLEAGIGQAAVTEATPRVASTVAGVATDAAAAGVRRLAGSGPGVAGKLARTAAEENRVIYLHNADKVAEAQQKWQDAQRKAAADHQAELLRLKQKYAQDTRAAQEKARTGTDADRAQYQAKQLAAKQKYEQSVRDAHEKFRNDVETARQANADAQRKYNVRVGQAVRQNRAVSESQAAAADRAARLQVGGSQLIYRLNQLDRALRDRANTMYDAIREKVGSASLPGTDLGSAAQTALEAVKGTSETPKIFRDIASKFPESNPNFIEYQGAQIPRGTPLYDVLAQHGVTEVPAVSFADLQGYYSELGKELSKGTLPGDVYQATRALQESVGEMMQKLADQAGVGKQLSAARKFYRGYMDIFHEPTGPSGSGSPVAQALLAKDPLRAAQAFGEKSGARGVADLRKYDDNLANLAQDLYRRSTSKVPVAPGGRKAVADIPQPAVKPVPAGPNLPLPPVLEPEPAPQAAKLPLPPILPEPETVPYRAPKLSPKRVISAADLQRANEAAVRARAAGLAGRLFWWTGIWPAFRVLSELSREPEVSLKPLALMPAAGAAGMATEELMAQPAVMEFLTKATRQQIAKIPPDLRGSMPDVVKLARARGVQVSPALTLYAATIQRNQQGDQQGDQR